MGRSKRLDVGNVVCHVLNRGNGRMTIFEDAGDCQAFERVLEQALVRYPQMQLLTYCVMPNHWHMVLRPTADGVLPKFVDCLRQAFFTTDELRSRQNNVKSTNQNICVHLCSSVFNCLLHDNPFSGSVSLRLCSENQYQKENEV